MPKAVYPSSNPGMLGGAAPPRLGAPLMFAPPTGTSSINSGAPRAPVGSYGANGNLIRSGGMLKPGSAPPSGLAAAPAANPIGGTPGLQLSANIQAANATAGLNRVNQTTPFGSLKYTAPTEPGGSWSADTTLAPGEQANLDRSRSLTAGVLDSANRRVGMLDESPIDASKYNGPNSDTTNALYSAYTSRLDPQWERERAALESRLANQGINTGSGAYSTEFDIFGKNKNDAYNQAMSSAVQSGVAENSNAFNRAITARNQPLNELNTLLGASQGVTEPQFQDVPGATVNAPDILGAEALKYRQESDAVNREQDERASNLGAGAGLAGAAISAAGPKIFDKLLSGGGSAASSLVLPGLFGGAGAGGANLGMLAAEAGGAAAGGGALAGGAGSATLGAGGAGADLLGAGGAGAGGGAGGFLASPLLGAGAALAAPFILGPPLAKGLDRLASGSKEDPAVVASRVQEMQQAVQALASGQQPQGKWVQTSGAQQWDEQNQTYENGAGEWGLQLSDGKIVPLAVLQQVAQKMGIQLQGGM